MNGGPVKEFRPANIHSLLQSDDSLRINKKYKWSGWNRNNENDGASHGEWFKWQ